MNDGTLEMRDGLPEALKVLLREYPREGWQNHENFHGLISFWLDRHLMFREVMSKMRDLTEQSESGELEWQAYAAQLSRYARFFVQQLHGHHHMEDEHYFPALMKFDDRLKRGFAILDSDHHELDGQLRGFTDAANLVIKPSSAMNIVSVTEQFHEVLSRFDRFLDRHLVDEEELVVPVILKYGADDLL